MNCLRWGVALVALAGLIVTLGYRGTGLDDGPVLEAPLSSPSTFTAWIAQYVNCTWQPPCSTFSLSFLHPNNTLWIIKNDGEGYNLSDSTGAFNLSVFRNVTFVQKGGQLAVLRFEADANVTRVRVRVGREPRLMKWEIPGVSFEWGISAYSATWIILYDVYPPKVEWCNWSVRNDYQGPFIHLDALVSDCGYLEAPQTDIEVDNLTEIVILKWYRTVGMRGDEEGWPGGVIDKRWVEDGYDFRIGNMKSGVWNATLVARDGEDNRVMVPLSFPIREVVPTTGLVAALMLVVERRLRSGRA